MAMSVHREESFPPENAAPTVVSASRSSSDDLQDLLRAHLFGTTAVAQSVAGDAPPTWSLRGVAAGDRPEEGWAILGADPKQIRLHFVGDEIVDGFRLTQVFPDRVTIVGRDEKLTLRLPHQQIGGGVTASNAAEATRPPPPHLAAAIWHPPKGTIAPPLPAQLLLRPGPHYDAASGQYDGMRLQGTEAGLGWLGLKPSDVITAVDGQSILNSTDVQKALRDLSSGRTMLVTVNREGASMQVPVTIADPDNSPGG